MSKSKGFRPPYFTMFLSLALFLSISIHFKFAFVGWVDGIRVAAVESFKMEQRIKSRKQARAQVSSAESDHAYKIKRKALRKARGIKGNLALMKCKAVGGYKCEDIKTLSRMN